MKFRKRGIGKLFVNYGYGNLKSRVEIALIILIVVLISYSSWFLFFYAKPVATREEFIDAMSNCRDVSWSRDDAQASWLYKIKSGAKGDACNIEVKLLQMKEGTLSDEKLQGEKMVCIVQKGETQFPEEDITHCTGGLKEELQDIIIQRMHNYLLKNVGEIRDEFERL